MTQVNNQTKKEVCVLIRIKPKYTEEFCIMMIACKELCNRISKFKKLAKIDEAFSVLGPFDFLLHLSEKKYLCSWNDIYKDNSKLKDFLVEDLGASWVKGKGVTVDKKMELISIYDGNNKATLKMNRDKVTLTINGERTCKLVKKGDDIYRKEEEVDERINRTIFKFRKTLDSYIYETHTLTKYELSEFLEDECSNMYDYFEDKSKDVSNTAETIEIWDKDELEKLNAFLKYKCILYDYFKNKSEEVSKTAETTKIFKKCLDKETLCRLCGLRNRLEKAGKQININKIRKHVHVLIKVKPDCTEKFFLAMTIFKSLCRDSASQYLAEIPDTTCSIFGPYDFIFELIAKGAEGEDEEEITKKINRTIFEIRETLGIYIYETHTIEKFEIPMTKDDLESFFKNKIGEEYLVRLPHCDEEKVPDGEKVPHERHKPHDKIDLKEIRCAETTELKKLLENAKTFLEPENLDDRLIDLNSRVEKLEKKAWS